MSEITKRALATSLKKLLSQKELTKISIKDITDDCGVKRQTFYYHFADVYDLIEWIYTNEVIKPIIHDKDTYEKWQEGFLSIFNYVLDNKDFVKNTYNSISRKYVNKFIYEQTDKLLKNVIDEEAEKESIKVQDEDKAFIATFYRYSFVGIIQNWIEEGMKESPKEIIEKLDKFVKKFDIIKKLVIENYKFLFL